MRTVVLEIVSLEGRLELFTYNYDSVSRMNSWVQVIAQVPTRAEQVLLADTQKSEEKKEEPKCESIVQDRNSVQNGNVSRDSEKSAEHVSFVQVNIFSFHIGPYPGRGVAGLIPSQFKILNVFFNFFLNLPPNITPKKNTNFSVFSMSHEISILVEKNVKFLIGMIIIMN